MWAAFIDQGTMAGTVTWTGVISLFATVLTLLCPITMPHATPTMIVGIVAYILGDVRDHQAPRTLPHLPQQPHGADTIAQSVFHR